MAAVMRVATWNMHEGLPATKPGRWPFEPANRRASSVYSRPVRDATVQLINDLDPDVLALQEVRFDSTAHAAILDDIKSRTGLKYIAGYPLSPSSFFSDARAGVAIASRHPLRDVQRQLLPNPNLVCEADDGSIVSFDKGWITAVVEIDGRLISVVSLHMVPFHIFHRTAEDPAFREIWHALSGELRRLARYPLITCGDFNTDRRDLFADDAPRLSSAFETTRTYNDLAYDDVLFTAPFVPVRTTTIDNFSDHALCLVELVTAEEERVAGKPTGERSIGAG